MIQFLVIIRSKNVKERESSRDRYNCTRPPMPSIYAPLPFSKSDEWIQQEKYYTANEERTD